MVGAVRGVSTLLGVAAASFLLWLSTHMGEGLGGYWSRLGLIAAAGLALILSQVFGGWTKWGLPQLSGNVFVLGFLPAFFVAGWVLLSGQPDSWVQRHVIDWSGDLHVSRLVRHLREGYLEVLAFGLGVLLGFTADTRGPRPARVAPPPPRPEEPEIPAAEPADGEASESETIVAPPDSESETRVLDPEAPERPRPD